MRLIGVSFYKGIFVDEVLSSVFGLIYCGWVVTYDASTTSLIVDD